MSDTGLKLCKHCKWFKRGWTEPARFVKCGHVAALRFESDQLVDGSAPSRRYCSSMRDIDLCGPNGKLWEPKR